MLRSASWRTDVLRYLDGEAVHAYHERWHEKAGRWVRRHQLGLSLILMYLLMRVIVALVDALKRIARIANRSMSRRHRPAAPTTKRENSHVKDRAGAGSRRRAGLAGRLTALFTPEVRDQMMSIVIGSTGKGLITGLAAGWAASAGTR